MSAGGDEKEKNVDVEFLPGEIVKVENIKLVLPRSYLRFRYRFQICFGIREYLDWQSIGLEKVNNIGDGRYFKMMGNKEIYTQHNFFVDSNLFVKTYSDEITSSVFFSDCIVDDIKKKYIGGRSTHTDTAEEKEYNLKVVLSFIVNSTIKNELNETIDSIQDNFYYEFFFEANEEIVDRVVILEELHARAFIID